MWVVDQKEHHGHSVLRIDYLNATQLKISFRLLEVQLPPYGAWATIKLHTGDVISVTLTSLNGGYQLKYGRDSTINGVAYKVLFSN